jgi:aryl-alcohol dehydrogenase-like predicted oxidoreductase
MDSYHSLEQPSRARHCFWCNVFGWSIHDQATVNRLLDAVVDAGLTFLDSADMYVQWHRAVWVVRVKP